MELQNDNFYGEKNVRKIHINEEDFTFLLRLFNFLINLIIAFVILYFELD